MDLKEQDRPEAKGGPLRRSAGEAFLRLCDLMTRLRSPEGCAWDRAQDLHTLRPYLLEEAHEVLDVLDDLTPDGGGERALEHRDELGDLMLQIVFQAEIQREHGRFDVGDVCESIYEKLVRRHPHLFGAEEERAKERPDWEAIKLAEREAQGTKAQGNKAKSALDGVPRHLPALLCAYRVGQKAHRVGFDWPDPSGVLEKIEEELGEVKEAVAAGDRQRISDEIGDLLYAIVNLTRHFEIDPEACLRRTIGRFERRFCRVEERLAREGKSPWGLDLDELEAHWQAAKRELSDEGEA